MKDERTEDLNPGSEDIEEKVKRMMDPSLPDEPEPALESKITSKAKNIPIQAVSTPLNETSAEDTPSAPELSGKNSSSVPASKQAASGAKSKKVVIPISHDSVAADDKPDEPKADDLAEPETAPLVKKITITEHSESQAALAEKLDKAIADLNPAVPAPEPEASKDKAATETKAEQSDEPILEEAASDSDELEAAAADTDTDEPVMPESDETPVVDPAVIADPETDKAVEAIVAAEGDELLEVEDAVRDTDQPVKTAKKPRRSVLKALKTFFTKPLVRKSLAVVVIGALIAAAFLPGSRYFMLNTLNVRSSSSLLILDNSTQQPLKNVQVSLAGVTGVTDVDGKLNLAKVKLGPTTLTIHKPAFAPITKKVVVGWGSNPLGDFDLVPTGAQYSFTVTDFLSGKPISKVEATSNDASAVSDEKGVIKLTIDKPNDDKLAVTLKGDGLRTEQLSIDPNDKSDHAIKLVPDHKQIFVTKRSGKYDIYSVYIDGKDEKLVLAGSGNERDDMVLLPHSTANTVAYVSTRPGQHNSDGYLLSSLILINTDDNSTTNVASAERIQIIGWQGNDLVYVQIAAGSSANSPKRYRLMSYNYQDQTNKELASSNFFNDVVAANGSIYYAPSSAYQTSQTAFYKVNPDGSGQQTVFGQEVWNIFRTSYDHFALSVQQLWYDYHVGDKGPTKLNSAPANQTSRVYIDSPDGKHSTWVDQRDGKGVLLSYDTTTKTDTVLTSQSGLSYPVSWLNNSVLVYRIKTDHETADYAISIDGGQPVKVRDVTNSGGISH